jgi:uncharacterized LabA/DUF88 family protein
MYAFGRIEGRRLNMSPFGIRDEQRVAVFIDGSGLYNATKQHGWEMDFRLLHSHFDANAMLYRIFYFTMLPEDQEEQSSVVPLVDWLSYNEYRTVTKGMQAVTDSEGRRRIKGSMLCEMTVEMLDSVAFADHFVLFSGDLNLRYVVDAVQRRGVKVTVAFPKTMITDELRRAADRFVDLADPAVRETVASTRTPAERNRNSIAQVPGPRETLTLARAGGR